MAKAKKRKAVVRKAKAKPVPYGEVHALATKMYEARAKEHFSSNRPLLAQMLKDAEMRAEAATQKYKGLRDKLVRLLNADQLDASRIAGCEPELYAIECIEIYKEQFFPHFSPRLRPLAALKQGDF